MKPALSPSRPNRKGIAKITIKLRIFHFSVQQHISVFNVSPFQPVVGCDPNLRMNLETFFRLDYPKVSALGVGSWELVTGSIALREPLCTNSYVQYL